MFIMFNVRRRKSFMENKEKIAKTINLIAFLISLLGSIFIIIKGETIEEYFHSLFFNNKA